MMKITKEGITFKTNLGAQLFKTAIFLGVFVICILLFGIITVS